jgi:hypothetical protein
MSMPALGTWKTRAMTPSSAGRLSFAAAPLLVLRGARFEMRCRRSSPTMGPTRCSPSDWSATSPEPIEAFDATAEARTFADERERSD